MKLRLTILFLLLACIGVSQNINIRIYSDNKIESFVFYAKSGKYDCVAHNKIICTVNEGQSATVSRKGHKITISIGQESHTADTLLLFRGISQDNIFQTRFHSKQLKAREYDNDLYVKTTKNGVILINDVNFEKYVAGVVESEGGAKAGIEYYKAQAILCRTYAAKFYTRHLKSGYNLCDAVHCQAYVGRSRYSQAIVEATNATKGLVLVDANNNLIEATFYSNSGGETCNSEDVWNKTIPYLRSKPDPYSIGRPAYEWQKVIPRQDWEKYLLKKGYPIADSADLSFDQFSRKKISLHRLYRLIGSTYHNPKRLETPLDIFLRRFTRKRSGSLRQRLWSRRGNGPRRSNGNGTTRIHLQGNTYVLLHKRVAHEHFKLEVFPN